MEHLNLLDQEIIELFNKLNLETLDSLDIIMPFVKKYDTEYINIALKIVANKKYQQRVNEDYYEPRNEYQETEYDISEIVDNFDSFNDEEQYFLNFIIQDAICNMPDNNYLANVKPLLVFDYLKIYNYLEYKEINSVIKIR